MYWRIKDKLTDLKWWLQRRFRGYSDLDSWNPYMYIAEKSIKVLKRYKEDTIGYPPEYNTLEEWKDDVQKMIDAFWYFSHDDEVMDKLIETYGDEKNKDGRLLWMVELDKEYKKAENGLKLFGEHFSHLWW